MGKEDADLSPLSLLADAATNRNAFWRGSGLAGAMPPSARAPIDHEALSEALAALAYPLRLELLEVLGVPLTLSEIKVRPRRRDADAEPAAAAAKQTVAAHLERLVEAGIVTRAASVEGGREVPTFAVDPQRLYAITEDLRRLSVRHSGRGRPADQTGTLVEPRARARAAGPRLVLAHGVYEGASYMLERARMEDGGWTIGRRWDAAVALDYDPFVSSAHARVEPDGRGMRLVDLPANKNGTMLNWDALERGGSALLARGDVIGVGRSLLIYYDA